MIKDAVSIRSLLGSSQAMAEVRAFAKKAAGVRAPVLILGETGTGKTMLGKIIHSEGPLASAPFVAVNCAGIPDTLFESEFFGHQPGAFTGARNARKGILEQAQGGSLFLDEVGELSIPQQAKLLTALEEGEVRRLGGEGVIRVNVRVLSATSRDLLRDMGEGRFRRELFHRLAVLSFRMPPLRDRKEDIPVLARRILRRHQARYGYEAHVLGRDSFEYLASKSWPGNVRELSHLLEAALVLSDGKALTSLDLQAAESMPRGGDEPVLEERIDGANGLGRYSFFGSHEEERELIREALKEAKGNKTRAARRLGMARTTLRSKLRRYRMD